MVFHAAPERRIHTGRAGHQQLQQVHERDLGVLADELTALSAAFNRPTLLAEVACHAWTTDWKRLDRQHLVVRGRK